MKCIALSLVVFPLGGCAIGVGKLFASFLTALSYAPDLEDTLFSNTLFGFAMIELFMVIILGVAGLIYTL